MTHLLFLPNDHLLIWGPLVNEPPGPLAARIESAGWFFPSAWLERIAAYFDLPDDLALHARAHQDMVVIYPHVPLVERIPGKRVRLTPLQRKIVRMLAAGWRTAEIADQLHFQRRWVQYQIAAVREKTVK